MLFGKISARLFPKNDITANRSDEILWIPPKKGHIFVYEIEIVDHLVEEFSFVGSSTHKRIIGINMINIAESINQPGFIFPS